MAERLCLHDIDDTVAFCGAIVGRSGIELSHYEREDLVAHLVGEAWIISTKYDESVGVAFSAWATLTLSGAWSTGNGSGSAAPPGSSRTAAAVREAEEHLKQQREELREAVIYAHREGVPIARIAREAGLSRQYVSGIVHGR